MSEQRYRRPGLVDRLFNGLVAGLARLGVSLWGSCELTVRGRKSGVPRSVPVNVVEHDGARYLVAPRGETEWVRNLRAAGVGELRLGSRVEAFRAREVADADKPPVLRAYLARWWFEVSRFFDLPNADPGDAELLRVAPRHPVFLLERV
ncbi:nitroreductase family deazaflavin-dependent oxidoreductase [Candidatus Binatia bacterium]|nr:nitroreductase family deazaflavin-dependent oxidoreductase [Candidatus Binatia bacterium]